MCWSRVTYYSSQGWFIFKSLFIFSKHSSFIFYPCYLFSIIDNASWLFTHVRTNLFTHQWSREGESGNALQKLESDDLLGLSYILKRQSKTQTQAICNRMQHSCVRRRNINFLSRFLSFNEEMVLCVRFPTRACWSSGKALGGNIEFLRDSFSI